MKFMNKTEKKWMLNYILLVYLRQLMVRTQVTSCFMLFGDLFSTLDVLNCTFEFIFFTLKNVFFLVTEHKSKQSGSGSHWDTTKKNEVNREHHWSIEAWRIIWWGTTCGVTRCARYSSARHILPLVCNIGVGAVSRLRWSCWEVSLYLYLYLSLSLSLESLRIEIGLSVAVRFRAGAKPRVDNRPREPNNEPRSHFCPVSRATRRTRRSLPCTPSTSANFAKHWRLSKWLAFRIHVERAKFTS